MLNSRMAMISLEKFLSKQPTIRKSVEALAARGIVVSYWTLRRWRNNSYWPCAAMKQLLAQKGIKA